MDKQERRKAAGMSAVVLALAIVAAACVVIFISLYGVDY